MNKNYIFVDFKKIYRLVIAISLLFFSLYGLLTPLTIIFFDYEMGYPGSRLSLVNRETTDNLFQFGLFFLISFVFYSIIFEKYILRFFFISNSNASHLVIHNIGYP